MNRIEVKVLNTAAIAETERMSAAMARMTQKGHAITTMEDFEALYERPVTSSFVETLCELPHPTLQKFSVINVAIVGASRRFLAQITRHQNEVKFMSGSLQYSDYSGAAQFVVPYEVTKADYNARQDAPNFSPSSITDAELMSTKYLEACGKSLEAYEMLAKIVGRDAAGYAMPQGMRNVLIISATPYQWKHMIGQRICRRNTLETQYVMLKCWEELSKLSVIFNNTGPSCMLTGRCAEGNMSCKHFLYDSPTDSYVAKYSRSRPTALLDVNFPLIRGRLQ